MRRWEKKMREEDERRRWEEKRLNNWEAGGLLTYKGLLIHQDELIDLDMSYSESRTFIFGERV